MTTRLDPLSHDEVATGLLSREGLGGRACLPRDERATAFGDSNQIGIWIAVKELDDIGRGSRSFDRLPDDERNQEPDSDRPTREGSSAFHAPVHLSGRGRVRNHSQAACLRNGRRQRRRSDPPSDASWIGSRQPTTSVNAVI